ncbi:MAG: zinc ribbon domain-containing protein [Chloroflexi bacterium]|nr:zinc ribbon domain-containing protein [Ktedonobacteraceae bacterium]MBV9022186.1 zinc ribbon domain-containing protein [Ktedonobacteraceae bacterium]MBV9706023.1 zinc ribbon domain-containing protein [Chloroflexota bacterium]
MNCSRCQAEIQDTATFCPQCGTPVYQSVTTPVPSMQTEAHLQLPPASQRAMFSYLPTGTPPWPSTISQELPSNRPSPQLTMTDMRAQAERKKPSMRGAVLIAFLLVLTPILGALFTLGALYAKGEWGSTNIVPQPALQAPAPILAPTPSVQTDQLPTPTTFKETSNADVNVSFKYPTDWQAQAPQKSTDSTSLAVQSAQQPTIIFIVQRLSDSTSLSIRSADAINQQVFSNVSSTYQDTQAVPAPTNQPLVGGVNWPEQDATFTDSGNKIHFATLSVQHNKSYYNIVVFIPALYYDEAMRKYINPILSSLRFLS